MFVREDALLDRLDAFLSNHLFGAYRHSQLDANIRTLDTTARHEREQQKSALRRHIADTDTKIKRTVRNLDLVDDPDQDLIRDINERRAELRAHKRALETQLADVEEHIQQAPNPT